MAKPDPLNLRDVSPLAVGLMNCLTTPDIHDAILGDLQEELTLQQFQTHTEAKQWLWGQVLRSAPHLTRLRFRQTRPTRFLLLLITYFGLFLGLALWDTGVSRTIIGTFAASDNPPNLIMLRTGYFCLFALGCLIVGALAAPIGFKADRSFAYNVALCFVPVFLILNLSTFLTILSAGRFEAIPYIATRALIMAVTLALGAHLYERTRRAFLA